MELLEPFEPTPEDPWDFAKAAHLARRAGFGEPPGRVAELVRMGPEAAVDAFVDFPEVDEPLEREIELRGGDLTDLDGDVEPPHGLAEAVRRWWLYRMVRGSSPLQEKLTLCWHDHFACQTSDAPNARLMLHQNRTFRRLGAGRFGDLLRAVARDPAMLVFLDGRSNVASNPNENWARELLELFTLGLDRYTQQDVVEIARAFTGWTTKARDSLEFRFDPDSHDAGDKVVFGRGLRGRSGPEGIEEGEEVLARILADPQCHRYVAARLVSRFVHDAPTDAGSPADAAQSALTEAVAAELAARDGDVRETLRTLFRSRAFHDPRWQFARLKSPVELAVSALRPLGVQGPHLMALTAWLRRMGMDLLQPPSVAGWDGGPAWIQTGFVVERANFALAVSTLAHATRRVDGAAAADFDAWAPAGADDGRLVDELARRLLQRPLRRAQRRELLLYLAEDEFHENPEPLERRKARALVHLLMATPEFALC